MTGQRLLTAGLWIAIVSVVASSGDADARCRCRGRGFSQGNGYAYNSGGAYNYGTQNGYVNGTNVYTSNPQTAPMPANAPAVQTNGTYSVGKPAIPGQAPVNDNRAPAPVNGNLAPNSPPPQPEQPNSSPDPDNEGRNASKIPGTAPTKAPAPAADAKP